MKKGVAPRLKRTWVEVHKRKIHTKFEANPCSGLLEVENRKNNIARVTLTH